MKKIFDPQLQKHHLRAEEGDVIKLVVDDETAAKIVEEDRRAQERAWAEAEAIAAGIKQYLPLHEGLKAPREWHEANFLLGRDVPSAKEISSKRLVEDNVTGEMDEIRSEAGTRGAVASGKKQEDDTIEWDWNYEHEDVYQRNLLDFYVLPEPNKKQTEVPYIEDKEYDNENIDDTPLPYKPSQQVTWGIAEHRDYIARVAMRMRNGNVDYVKIRQFIEDQKTARNCR